MPIIGGDDIVNALEAHLHEAIPKAQEALKLTHLGEVKVWQILPDKDAIATSQYPAIAIVAAEAEAGERSVDGYSATWDVSVGAFARGTDHKDTQNIAQQWAKTIRYACLMTPVIPDTEIEMTWVGESSNIIASQQDARTLGACEVMFDAYVENAFTPDDIDNGTWPLVKTTYPAVDAQEPEPPAGTYTPNYI